MAIALDSASNWAEAFSVSTLSWSHTCSGSDRILFVAFVHNDDTVDRVTGITYNSVSMTRINSSSQGTDGRIYLYYLVAPATGSNTVTVSMNASDDLVRGISVSYTGASQTGVPDAQGTTTFSAVTSGSLSVTSIANNCWMVMSQSYDANVQPTAGASTTKRGSSSGIVVPGVGFYDTNGAITPAGSRTLNWNSGLSTKGQTVGATFAPSVAAVTAIPDARVFFI